MIDNNRDSRGDISPDNDELAADEAVNEGGKIKKEDPTEIPDARSEPNPPRTTSGKWFTTPKFGSAGSGGLEIEPGLDKD